MPKQSPNSPPKKGSTVVGRDAHTGTFVVAKPAVAAQSLKPRAISEAVRKVNLAQQAANKK